MTEEQKEKYKVFVNEISELLGLEKPVDIIKLCVITDKFFNPIQKQIKELEAQIEEMKKEVHHRLVSPSRDESDCLDKIISLDRLWQFGQEF